MEDINNEMLAMEISMKSQMLQMENQFKESISKLDEKYEALRQQMQNMKKPFDEIIENNQNDNVNIT